MNPLDVRVWGDPPESATEIPELRVWGGLGLRSAQAIHYARQERGMEPAVRFSVFDENGYFGEFFYSEGGWKWE